MQQFKYEVISREYWNVGQKVHCQCEGVPKAYIDQWAINKWVHNMTCEEWVIVYAPASSINQCIVIIYLAQCQGYFVQRLHKVTQTKTTTTLWKRIPILTQNFFSPFYAGSHGLRITFLPKSDQYGSIKANSTHLLIKKSDRFWESKQGK